uniref:Uncharacterized protein n=1 Tax=Timema poppense TaxID=170557 RepID=A0A7R9CYK4_TIMPO|nr:unnamed protein product [Timema poppensis]
MRKRGLVERKCKVCPPPIFVWLLSALCAGADETALTKKELDQLQACLTSTNTLVNEVEETHMDVRHKLQKISLEMAQLNGKLHLMHAICVKLLHLGREYPQGYDYFRARLKRAFTKNRDVVEPDQIELLLSHGQFVVKELEALYMLRKYRTLKKRYYHDS